MPTVAVERDALFKVLGRTYTDKEFDELCFEFGIELDEVTTEQEQARKMAGKEVALAAGAETTLYKIDIPANRYDLLCLEGLGRALLIFLKKQKAPNFRLVEPAGGAARQRMTVKAPTGVIRPYVVCAILRNCSFDHLSYNSFLDLQEKLHFNICRRRSLVAIGTHDLSSIKGPFTYDARPPQDIKFVPLQQEKEYRADELLDWYRTDEKGKHIKPYTDLIYDSPVYPVITDADGTVLSLPPIINGSHSKISPATKDVFIECTATDHTKGHIVLQTIVAMFSQYCADPFTIEPVDVVYENDGIPDETTPDLKTRDVEAKVPYIKSLIGVEDLETSKICDYLDMMQLPATLDVEKDAVTVAVPITRSDILHACDVAEDVAIAYGYNNVVKRVPPVLTTGKEQPVNLLTDLLRPELAGAGFTEVMTLALCSQEETFEFMNHKDDGKTAVVLSNPMTECFQIVRTSLLPGIMKTLENNKSLPKPLKLFEVSDVVLLDESADVGARNERRLAAVFVGQNTSGLEVIHGIVDRIMQLLAVHPSIAYIGQDDWDKLMGIHEDDFTAGAETKMSKEEVAKMMQEEREKITNLGAGSYEVRARRASRAVRRASCVVRRGRGILIFGGRRQQLVRLSSSPVHPLPFCVVA